MTLQMSFVLYKFDDYVISVSQSQYVKEQDTNINVVVPYFVGSIFNLKTIHLKP